MYYDLLFYVFAALSVLSAIVVVFSRSVIYAAFSLVFTFLGVAGIFALLSADFLAVSQVMVYVGGIMVLLIFGVMLTNKVVNVDISGGSLSTWPATIIVGVLLGTLALIMTGAQWLVSPTTPEVTGTALEIGELLLTRFLLPFEVVGLLLLVAIMGAAMIARKLPVDKESV